MNYSISKVLFIFQAVFSVSTLANDIETTTEGEEFKSHTMIFKKLSKRSLLKFSLENQNRLEKRKTQAFAIEYTRFFTKNFSIYAQYEKKYGERFDEDWIKDANGWLWADTNSRNVNWAYLGVGYRDKIKFLPGKNWKFNIKTGLKHNLFNSQLSYQITPTITYFSYSDAKLTWSYFLQSDVFYGVNFAKNNIYRWYSYLGFLRHFNKKVAIGSFIGLTTYHWFSTDEMEQITGKTRKSTNESTLLGLVLNLKI